MHQATMILDGHRATSRLAENLFDRHRERLHKATDHIFAGLLALQWPAAVATTLVLSPRTWAGATSWIHPHLYASTLLGGAIVGPPIVLALTRPGKTSTRHSIAVSQMLIGALLIHLSGGRIEAHFHIFASLAFLAFYRDWTVLVSASIVVAADHLLRGAYWPRSVFGIAFIEPWRWAEHIGWVIIEDVVLGWSCIRGVREIRDVAGRQAALEHLREQVERQVEERTSELHESESLKASIIATALDAIVTMDHDGRIVEFNPAAEEIFGYSRDQAKGRPLEELIIPLARRQAHRDAFAHVVGPGRTPAAGRRIEVSALRADGTEFAAEISITPVRRQDAPPLFVGFARDITERKRAERANARLATIVESSDDAIVGKDPDSTINFWNAGAERLFGYNAEEAVGRPVTFLMPPDRLHEEVDILARLRRGERIDHFESIRIAKDGRAVDVSLTISPIRDADGRLVGISKIARDITERKRAEERLAHQATHDTLTGLPNRARFQSELERHLGERPGPEDRLALLLVDLDRFKEVNDAFGHHFGDLLLQGLAPRLRDVLDGTGTDASRSPGTPTRRPSGSATIARLGGDEFGILLPGVDDAGAIRVAEAILAAMRQPIVVAGRPLDVGASIGVALSPGHARDPIALMQCADLAMYAAKQAKVGYLIYSDDQAESTPRRMALIGELRRGIEQDQLLLHYQPKIDLRTQEVNGVEALVRWLHPREGLLFPGEFIGLAEDTGLIRPLTSWVLRAALSQARAWHHAGLRVNVAVNLAVDMLKEPSLVEMISADLEGTGARPEWLTLEVTESAVMTDPKSARTTLARLRGMGTRISIDDFGTGYSSLAYLRDLPADEVKIDRSFVKEMGSREQDACIVRSIIELGHNLGLRVVAEGVEDRTTADRLAEMGCDHAQGFYLTRPLPPGDFAAWLAANRQIPLPRENAVRGPRMMAIRDSENLLNASGSPNLTASPTSTAASIRDWSTTRSSRTMSSKSADA